MKSEGVFIFKGYLPEAISETSRSIDKLDKIATFVNTGITVNDIVNQGKRVQKENEEKQANAN
ncbi:hypothetical protein BW716_31675 [[Flexibacter] sp. ATCC 35208]|nr:hypothetical protein BW716_31675 [[Flexibacter] sp. ATCC 35208]